MRIEVNFQVGQLILRFLQKICAAAIITPAAILIVGQHRGGVPPATVLAFVSGVLSVIVATYGFIASFLRSLQGHIMAGFDGVITALYIICTILMTVKLGNHSCDPASEEEKQKIWTEDIINAGRLTTDSDGKRTYKDYEESTYMGRCGLAKAETVFLYFGVILGVASLIHDLSTILRNRRGREHKSEGLEKIQTTTYA